MDSSQTTAPEIHREYPHCADPVDGDASGGETSGRSSPPPRREYPRCAVTRADPVVGDATDGETSGRDSPSPRREGPTPLDPTATHKVVKGCLWATTRAVGSADGPLFAVGDLSPFRRLGHGVPVAFLTDLEPFDRATSDAEFRDRLRSVDPEIADLPLRRLKLVLAGGSVCAHLMRLQRERLTERCDRRDYDDYDLFLVGHDDRSSAIAAIAELHALLAKSDEKAHLSGRPRRPGAHPRSGNGPVIYRTAGCITFHSERLGLKVQVILRRYRNIAEVLNGFDLGSSAMAWDGVRLLFTRAGVVAANHGANVIVPLLRRTSYEHRLIKYFRRGFDIALPGLNVLALKDSEYRLPFMTFVVCSPDDTDPCVCPCRIPCYGASRTPVGPVEPPTGANPTPLYDATIPYGDPGRIRHRNYREGSAPGGPNVLALCGYAPYADGMDYGSIEPEYPSASDVESMLKDAAYSGLQLRSLRRAIGVAATRDFVSKYMQEVFPLSPSDNDYFDKWRKVAAGVTTAAMASLPRLAIPFDIPDAALLGGSTAATRTTARQWYGQAYSRSLLDSMAGMTFSEKRERGYAFAAGRTPTETASRLD